MSYWSKIAKLLYPTDISPPPHGGWSRRNFAKMLISLKWEWFGYHVVKKLWQTVKPFRYNTGTWRTDKQTDFLYQYRASVCWRAIKSHKQKRNSIKCYLRRLWRWDRVTWRQVLRQRSDHLHRPVREQHRRRAPAERSLDHTCLVRPECAGDRSCSKRFKDDFQSSPINLSHS